MNPTQPCSANGGQTENSTDFQCRLVVLPIGELCPHPSYIRHQLSASASHLSALAVTTIGSRKARSPRALQRGGSGVKSLDPCSVRQRPQRRRPIVGRSASATPALGAAECATARRETHHNACL